MSDKCRKCGGELTRGKCVKCSIDELWKTDAWRNMSRLLKKIDIQGKTNPLTNTEPTTYLKTNTLLDKLFGGGIRQGQLVELYGEFASGKTQICFSLVVESEGKVVYIDSEHTFSPIRIKQIAEARGKKIEDIDKRLLLFKPKDWKEQMAIPHQLPDVENVHVIIVDSLLSHFRSSKEFIGRDKLTGRQGLIRSHLADLRNLAQRYNCMVVFTNQVYDIPDSKPFTPFYRKQIGVGGHSVHHVPDVIIYLRKAKDPKRIARLMDSSELPNIEQAFMIGKAGIEDTPEEKEAQEKQTKEEQTDE